MKNNVKFLEINKCKVAIYPILEMRTAEVTVSIRAGSGYEPGDSWGGMHLLEHVIFTGTKSFPTMDLLDVYREKYGISDGGWVSGTMMDFSFKFPGVYLNQAVRYIKEFLFRPLLTEEAVEKEKKVIGEEYKDRMSSPYKVMDMKTFEMLFGKYHPFTKDGIGQIDFINKLSPADLKKLYRKYFQPQNMVITVVGRVDPKEVIEKLKKILMPRKNTFLADKKFADISPGGHLLEVEDVRVDRSTVSYYWIIGEDQVKNLAMRIGIGNFKYIFGSTSRSPLFQAIRNKQGLAYSFNCNLWGWRNLRVFEVWAKVDRQREQEFEDLVKRELGEFLNKGVTPEEYQRVNRFLDIRSLMAYDSISGISDVLADGLFWEDRPIMPEEKNRMARKIGQEEVWEMMRNNLKWEKVYKAVLRGK